MIQSKINLIMFLTVTSVVYAHTFSVILETSTIPDIRGQVGIFAPGKVGIRILS